MIAGAIAFLGVLGVAALLVAGRRVPAWVGLSPVALPLLVASLSASGKRAEATDPWRLPPELWGEKSASGLVEAMERLRWIELSVGIPALVLMLACAIPALRRGPRNPIVALMGALLCVVLTLLPLHVFLTTYPDTVPTLMRTAGVGLLGLLSCVCLVGGGDEQHNGAEAAAIGAGAGALGMAAIAVGAVAWDQQMVFEAVAYASMETRATLAAAGLAVTSSTLLTAVLLAGGGLLLGCLGAAACATLGGSRRVHALVGLGWLPVAIGTVWSVDLVPARAEAEVALMERVFPSASANLMLPLSIAQRKAPVATPVVMTADELRVDGEVIASLYGGEVPTSKELAELRAELEDQAASIRASGGAVEDRPHQGTPLLQVHQDLSYAAVGPVLASLTEAGWGDVQVVVQGEWGRATVQVEATPPGRRNFLRGGELGLIVQISSTGFVVGSGGDLTSARGAVRLPCRKASCEEVEDFDLDELTALLRKIKRNYPDEESVAVAVSGDVSWDVVVATLDATRVDDSEMGPDGLHVVLFPYVTFDSQPR